MELCSAAEMMAIDRQAIQERGLPGVVLMENAGRACCDHFVRRFAGRFPGPVLILAGKGNNGGDGYVMARLLSERGWQVQTLVLGEPDKIGGDAALMLNCLQQQELPLRFVGDSVELEAVFAEAQAEVIIDALFGTGLNSAVRGLPAAAIELINGSPAAVFAVDVPSGVDAGNGRICGCAVQADLTVSFDRAKIGHASQPGAACVGSLEIVDIGIPRRGRLALSSACRLIDAQDAAALLPERSRWGHKGRFGHLLVVAGSRGKTGAATLAGEAAVRSACGLVTVATPAAVHDIIEVKLTEAMSFALPGGEQLSLAALAPIEGLLAERQALVFGPGLGVSDELRELLRGLLKSAERPLLVDADGLSLLAAQLDSLQQSSAPLVLTPHPGEMARLTGLTVAEIEADRYQVARDFAAEHGVVLLLKGARTLVAAPDGRVNINACGNDGLASGGSGDVLSGLIGGLLAQGMAPFEAASLAVWLHGRSAELVAAENGAAGLAASDLLPRIPLARQELAKGVY